MDLGQPLENHDRGLMLHCITAAKVEARGMGNQSMWAQICIKLPAIQELIEGGELEANCCSANPDGAVVKYADNHRALIKPVVDAFPDPRQLAPRNQGRSFQLAPNLLQGLIG